MEGLQEKVDSIPYWYHKIELPGGVVTPGWAPLDASAYSIPDDMTGMRVLDVGAWDGYWTFEALKRGAAEVVAIDDFSDNLGALEHRGGWDAFDLCRDALGYTTKTDIIEGVRCEARANDKGQVCARATCSVYELDAEALGRFDIVFFFGTLYHLRHPLAGLDRLTALCDGAIYIESAICDDFSPYNGGMGKGYAKNDMVMEFYPGKQYGGNENNWWAPTLQLLGSMLDEAGFQDVRAWALTDNPKQVAECRGFACGTRDPKKYPVKTPEQVKNRPSRKPPLKVAAVMSVPRLGFMDNFGSVFEALMPYKIQVYRVQGAFWGQCLERGLMKMIDDGVDAVLTIDYDTVFSREDFAALTQLLYDHDEADALVPIQMGRQMKRPLLTMRGASGQRLEQVPMTVFEPELTQISTGHFGLTLIRTSSLLKLPHPWFLGQPDPEGTWGEGRVDDDIHFWNLMREHNMKVYSANRIVIGHMELMVTWPDETCVPIHQHHADYHKDGKPQNVWK